MKTGKRYSEAAKLIEKTKTYDLEEAVALVKKTASAKFDETIEAHFRLGVDGRHKRNQDMGGDKMSHSPYLDSCNMIEKSFFSDKAPIYNKV